MIVAKKEIRVHAWCKCYLKHGVYVYIREGKIHVLLSCTCHLTGVVSVQDVLNMPEQLQKGQDKEILVHSLESTTHRTMVGNIVMALHKILWILPKIQE